MRLPPLLLSVVLAPGLLAVPTASWHHSQAHPVTPRVSYDRISGVDAAALAADRLAPATERASRQAEASGAGASRAAQRSHLAVFTAKRAAARFTMAGVSWAADSATPAAQVVVRARVRERGRWTRWEQLASPDNGPDPGTAEARTARAGTEPLLSAGADGVQVRVDTPTGAAPRDLRVGLVDPGSSGADTSLSPQRPAASAVAATGAPTIISRAEWGADETLRGAPTYNSTVQAVIIHHTAGSNDYTPETAPAQVRAIYAYDTKVLGWSDIAYNFLVDKWGRVYEGRAGSITSAVRGAHTGGFNVDTMGVSAIGNYETVAPPAVMVEAMAQVTGWKLGQYGRDPQATVALTSQGGGTARFAAGTAVTVGVVAAHRDTGNTACPGQYLFPQMAAIRAQAAVSALSAAPIGPPTPAPPVPPTVGATPPVPPTVGATPPPGAAPPAPTTPAPATTAPATPTSPRPLVSPLSFTASRDRDGRPGPDALAVNRQDQRMYLFAGNGAGRLLPRVALTGRWARRDAVTGVGDLDGDRHADVIARDPRTGRLWLYPGTGSGGLRPARLIGTGWRAMTAVAGVGDFTGDGHNDVLTVQRSGKLWLYPGTGTGRLGPRRLLAGSGWSGRDMLTGVGDLTGDGRVDVVARTVRDGRLHLYAGNGRGRFTSSKVLGTGWQAVRDIAATGDFTGDGRNDLLAVRKFTGVLQVYPGTGRGGLSAPRRIGTGWRVYDLVD